MFQSVEGLVVFPSASIEKAGPLRETFKHKAKFPEDAILFATAGSKGCVRIWSSSMKHSLLSLPPLTGSTSPRRRKEDKEEEVDMVGGSDGLEEVDVPTGGYTGLHFNECLNMLAAVTYDHNIVFYNSLSFERKKQVCYIIVYSRVENVSLRI